MTKRILTGAGFVIVVISCILLGRWPLFALMSAAMVVSVYEVYKAIRNTDIEPVRWAGYVCCGLIILAQLASFFVEDKLNFSTFALLASVLAAMIRLVLHGEVAVDSMIATVFPMLYPCVFYMAMMNMLVTDDRVLLTVCMIICFFSASINDACALFSGMLFGKHKLAPVLSPKKTVEGAIGGLICCTLFTMAVPSIVGFFLRGDPNTAAGLAKLPPVWVFALLGFVVSLLTQAGDLTASMVKRHCKVKDFGNLLPGHGGVMDRLDGVIFAGAACYLFFQLTRFRYL